MFEQANSNETIDIHIRGLCEVWKNNIDIIFVFIDECHPFDYIVFLIGKESYNVEWKDQYQPLTYNSIYLEQWSSHEKTRGWVHNLIDNKVNYVIFYWNKRLLLKIFNATTLCNWWRNNCTMYTSKLNESSGNWTSSYSSVYLSKLPQDCQLLSISDINLEN